MRIISGKHKNRKIITAQKGINIKNLRPSTEKLREAIFNIINSTSHVTEDFLENANVLDLFCGSGALGLEALSRGAKFATFVDKEPNHISICKNNAAYLNEINNSEFIVSDATRLRPSQRKYNLLFLDPPYHECGLIPGTLEALEKGNWIDDQNIIIIEHGRREKFDLSDRFSVISSRTYGVSMLTICKFS